MRLRFFTDARMPFDASWSMVYYITHTFTTHMAYVSISMFPKYDICNYGLGFLSF